MTTNAEAPGPSEAEKIWAEMDATDAGKTVEVVPKEPEVPDKEAATTAKPGEQAPQETVDTTVPGGDPATPDQQTLLDKVNGLESQLGQALARVRKVEGQYGGINSQLQQQLKNGRDPAEGVETPSAKELRDAQKNPEAMAKLKTDYPEFGAAMEAVLDERLSGVKHEIEELRRQAGQPQLTAADLDTLRNKIQVEVVHPGWERTVQQPEFSGWLNRQPREVQLLAESESPQDAIRLLDLHVEARKATSRQNTQRRLESAAAIPSGRSAASTRAKPVEDMTPEEYWRYLDQVEAQQVTR